jgi:1,2-diacylglycerol 3-alpha-glucosyltransferase
VRVALVNNLYPPPPGGSGHFTQALAHELGTMGHDVLVITAAGAVPAGGERCGPFAIERVPSWSLPPTPLTLGYRLPICLWPRGIRRCLRVLDDFSPDVVHENSQILDLSLVASAWAARRDVPVVVTIHTALIHVQKVPSVLLSLIDRALSRTFIREAQAHVVAPDRFMREYVARRYGLRGPDRVSNIPIGVDLTHLGRGSADRARADLRIGDRPLLLSLGHVTPLRDRLPLVEALPAVLREVPDLVVAVAGRVYDDRFQRRARDLGVGHALLVLGEVPKEQVADLVAAADVGCHELAGIGFGTASLELLGAGVASAAFVRSDNFPGLPLRDGLHVAMVSPDDPDDIAETLIHLLQSPNARARLCEAGRQFVDDHFTIRRVAEQYMELYERLLGEPDVGAATSAAGSRAVTTGR